MEKREWTKPELNYLSVDRTEQGPNITPNVDDTIWISGIRYTSFSG